MTTMRTAGIDLAVQPSSTGIAIIDWHTDGSGIASLGHAAGDDAIIELLLDENLEAIGLDVPLGWPAAFVDAVATRHDGQQITGGSWNDFYARTRLRATDRWLRESSASASPTSVSMDKIGDRNARRMAPQPSRGSGAPVFSAGPRQ